MAICIDGNFICLGGGCFCQTPTGIEFSGEAVANAFLDCRVFQGTIAGYTSTGQSRINIDKFPFTSDSPATCVGDVTVCREGASGHSSDVSGYTSGSNTLDKFPFASDTDAVDVAEEANPARLASGHSTKINGFGHKAGGLDPASSPATVNQISKFPFASDSTIGTDVGELTQARFNVSEASSNESGYSVAGRNPDFGPGSCLTSTIDKFPFSADASATSVGGITAQIRGAMGNSSDVSGYASGGRTYPGHRATIDKFPFSSDTNASNIGNLVWGRYSGSGASSTTFGYTAAGYRTPGPFVGNQDFIEKFPFASDTNSSDIAELTVPRSQGAGQQV